MRHWREVLGVGSSTTLADIERAYKERRSAAHPDKGGTDDDFRAVQEAWEQAQQEVGR